MRIIVLIYFLKTTLSVYSQQYKASNIDLYSAINPAPDSLHGVTWFSGCWGWYQENKNREYALIGAKNGTYFIDITNPYNPVVADFVQGKSTCTWREIKTFKNYCYVVTECNEGLTIIDMQYLPDSVHVVSSNTLSLNSSHTIWIDGSKLYCSSLKMAAGNTGVGVFSLADPEQPQFLRKVSDDLNFVYAHDLYSRRDTLYVSNSTSGLAIIKYDSITNKFASLGSFQNYSYQGYNHSGYLTENGKYFVFCDEVPSGIPIHIADVSNFENIKSVSEFLPFPTTTPHNPYVLGNEWLIVSCYQDGLYIYDISDPENVKEAGFFDTHPQQGFDAGFYDGYNGNWGAYPFLPSKTLIALDMRNGAFFLNASRAYDKTDNSDSTAGQQCLKVKTNPASSSVFVEASADNNGRIVFTGIDGRRYKEINYEKTYSGDINLTELPEGLYLVENEGSCGAISKLIVTHRK